LDEIVLAFNNVVDPASFDQFAFTVRQRGTANTLGVTSATVVNGTNVLLVTDARSEGYNYDVIIASPGVGNTCTTTKVTGTFQLASGTFLVDIDGGRQWRYNDSGIDPGLTWMNTGFNDSAWPQGAAAFDSKRGELRTDITNTPVRTHMTLTNTAVSPFTNDIATYNFRTHLNLTAIPQHLQAVTFFDDAGAVFINGTSVLRLRDNLTNTFSILGGAAPTGETTYEGPFDLPTANLVVGDNVIAVEVKQSSITSSDATMGLRLIGFYTTVAPRLTIDPPDAFGDTTLTWGSGILQSSPNITGPWTDVSLASSPYSTGTTPGRKFYRLR